MGIIADNFNEKKEASFGRLPFSFGTRGAKTKLGKKKAPFFMGLLAPSPRKFFEKNLTKNFPLGCGANTLHSTVERTNYGKKIKPQFQSF